MMMMMERERSGIEWMSRTRFMEPDDDVDDVVDDDIDDGSKLKEDEEKKTMTTSGPSAAAAAAPSEMLERKEERVVVPIHRELTMVSSSSSKKSTFKSTRRIVVTTTTAAVQEERLMKTVSTHPYREEQGLLTETVSLNPSEDRRGMVVPSSRDSLEFRELGEQVIRLEQDTLSLEKTKTTKKKKKKRENPKKKEKTKEEMMMKKDLREEEEVSTLNVKGEGRRVKENEEMEMIRMSEEVMTLCSEFLSHQTGDEEKRRDKFVRYLSNVVQRVWSDDARLELYGSMANQLGHRGADIDACLIFEKDMMESRAKLLTRLSKYLRSARMEHVIVLKHARVPILKFKDPVSLYSCDICCENRLALHNTRLLKVYSLIDWRSRSLMLFVKYWAKRRRLNESSSGTLSSYGYVLMVIHFLQSRQPQILPCLQMMGESREVHLVDGCDVSFFESMDQLHRYGFTSTTNTESIGKLVFDFFKYYTMEYDYHMSVISVRLGKVLSRSEKEWTTNHEGCHRYTLCIEDPFDITHNLGRVISRVGFRRIRTEFMRAYQLLGDGQSMTELCSEITQISLDEKSIAID